MTLKIRLMLLLSLALVLPTSHADDRKYAPMPWHLVDLWWDLGKDTPFESYSIDVTISEDLPDSTNLYIAPMANPWTISGDLAPVDLRKRSEDPH